MSSRVWLRPVFIVSAALLALSACGGDDDDDGGDDVTVVDSGGGGTEVDAGGGGGGVDGGAVACAAPDLGAFDPLPGAIAVEAPQSPTTPDDTFLVALADVGDSTNDFLSVSLWDGFGAFADTGYAEGTYPQTFEIEGPEANYLDCGVCVVFEQAVTEDGQGNQVAAKTYIATSGTVEVTSVAGNFTATVTGATLAEAAVGQGEDGAPIDGGCSTATSSVTFDVAIMAPPAGN